MPTQACAFHLNIEILLNVDGRHGGGRYIRCDFVQLTLDSFATREDSSASPARGDRLIAHGGSHGDSFAPDALSPGRGDTGLAFITFVSPLPGLSRQSGLYPAVYTAGYEPVAALRLWLRP